MQCTKIAQSRRASGRRTVAGLDAIVFNAERWEPYNWVKLTPLLAGDVQLGQVSLPLTFPGSGRVTLYSDHSIVDIDRAAKTVTGRFGRVWPYSKLVLCIGSRAPMCRRFPAASSTASTPSATSTTSRSWSRARSARAARWSSAAGFWAWGRRAAWRGAASRPG